VHKRSRLTKSRSSEVYRNRPSSRGIGGSISESSRIQISKDLQGEEWKLTKFEIAKEILAVGVGKDMWREISASLIRKSRNPEEGVNARDRNSRSPSSRIDLDGWITERSGLLI
jgi:hypothetical protein